MQLNELQISELLSLLLSYYFETAIGWRFCWENRPSAVSNDSQTLFIFILFGYRAPLAEALFSTTSGTSGVQLSQTLAQTRVHPSPNVTSYGQLCVSKCKIEGMKPISFFLNSNFFRSLSNYF